MIKLEENELDQEIEEVISETNSTTHETIDNSKYLDRMDRNACVHMSKYSFKIGDVVFLKKDFTDNASQKRQKMEPFFEEENFEIIELLSNNFETIQGIHSSKTLKVALNRLKKK